MTPQEARAPLSDATIARVRRELETVGTMPAELAATGAATPEAAKEKNVVWKKEDTRRSLGEKSLAQISRSPLTPTHPRP